MRSMRLRPTMIVVAVIAGVLGIGLTIKRRSERLAHISSLYSAKAGRLENVVANQKMADDAAERLLREVHWHDAVANSYRQAASQPWMPIDPKPDTVTCGCHWCAKSGE